MPPLVLAVDGGNSKTDVALVDADGALLAWVRGPGSAQSPRRAAATVQRLAAAAAWAADLPPAALAEAHGACYLAGVDLPGQAEALQVALARQGVAGSLHVGNDAWALLRTGAAAQSPAVAVVCGAGLKCVARAGAAQVEFPGLGWQTGDLSGAGDFLAREAVRLAARAEDGRGQSTDLHRAVCEHLAVSSIAAVAPHLLAGTLTERQIGTLAPVVLRCADDGDPAASRLVRDLAAEVVVLARAARDRLGVQGSGACTLVLGGGLFADEGARLLAAVGSVAPDLEREFHLVTVTAPPVIGAILLGLEAVGVAGAGDAVWRSISSASPTSVGTPSG